MFCNSLLKISIHTAFRKSLWLVQNIYLKWLIHAFRNFSNSAEGVLALPLRVCMCRINKQKELTLLDIHHRYLLCPLLYMWCMLSTVNGSRDSLLVRAMDSWTKGCKFESQQERWENFLLKSQLCVLTYSVSIPCHVTAVACKRPWLFCQKCRWQVTLKHAYTLDPMKLEWAD